MFVLARMTDTVRIDPVDFRQDFKTAIRTTLNLKLANKVVLNVGLCISFFDFEKIEESFILPGDGGSFSKVHFRFVVFRPFIDEILVGKIRSCSRNGIHLNLGFFDDIFVPDSRLPDNSTFQETDQVWVWKYEVEPGNVADMFMEPGADVRFRVVDEEFRDNMPTSAPDAGAASASEESAVQPTQSIPSYTIIASMNEPGLGCLTWWT